MSKRKREATEGESANINGLKKARKDQRNGRQEEGAEENEIIAAQPNASVNGHVIVPGADTEEEKLAIKLARKQGKKEKRQREKDRKIELQGEGNDMVDVVVDARKKKRRSRVNGEKGAVEELKDSAWRVSDPVGGRLLDLDPVFSPDEKYVCLRREDYRFITDCDLPR